MYNSCTEELSADIHRGFNLNVIGFRSACWRGEKCSLSQTMLYVQSATTVPCILALVYEIFFLTVPTPDLTPFSQHVLGTGTVLK